MYPISEESNGPKTYNVENDDEDYEDCSIDSIEEEYNLMNQNDTSEMSDISSSSSESDDDQDDDNGEVFEEVPGSEKKVTKSRSDSTTHSYSSLLLEEFENEEEERLDLTKLFNPKIEGLTPTVSESSPTTETYTKTQ